MTEPRRGPSKATAATIAIRGSVERQHFAEIAICDVFVQDSQSRSAKGTIRRLHYQPHPGEGKLVPVARGRIWDVVVCIRRSSPTFGRHLVSQLDDVRDAQVDVPIGFADGFWRLSARSCPTGQAPFEAEPDRRLPTRLVINGRVGPEPIVPPVVLPSAWRSRRPAAHVGSPVGPGPFARLVRDRGLVVIGGLAIALATWPVTSITPTYGLDPSWRAALHLAAYDHLRFGPDLVFTYGPLGFLTLPQLYFTPTAMLAFAYVALAHLTLAVTLVHAAAKAMRRWLVAMLALSALLILPQTEPSSLLTVTVLVWVIDDLAAVSPSRRLIPILIGMATGIGLLTKFNDGLAMLAAGSSLSWAICLDTGGSLPPHSWLSRRFPSLASGSSPGTRSGTWRRSSVVGSSSSAGTARQWGWKSAAASGSTAQPPLPGCCCCW